MQSGQPGVQALQAQVMATQRADLQPGTRLQLHIQPPLVQVGVEVQPGIQLAGCPAGHGQLRRAGGEPGIGELQCPGRGVGQGQRGAQLEGARAATAQLKRQGQGASGQAVRQLVQGRAGRDAQP
ncbi:hypothetical protein I0E51_09315 [Pseudomonas lalucatii]|nr:hypothetical protein [Pseudomonas lalucatii]